VIFSKSVQQKDSEVSWESSSAVSHQPTVLLSDTGPLILLFCVFSIFFIII
jgi:hypothetical protein